MELEEKEIQRCKSFIDTKLCIVLFAAYSGKNNPFYFRAMEVDKTWLNKLTTVTCQAENEFGGKVEIIEKAITFNVTGNTARQHVQIGLNIFYSEEKDWTRHSTRQCPLQQVYVLKNTTHHLTTHTHTHAQRTLCKKASNHHANLPLEMYSFTL